MCLSVGNCVTHVSLLALFSIKINLPLKCIVERCSRHASYCACRLCFGLSFTSEERVEYLTRVLQAGKTTPGQVCPYPHPATSHPSVPVWFSTPFAAAFVQFTALDEVKPKKNRPSNLIWIALIHKELLVINPRGHQKEHSSAATAQSRTRVFTEAAADDFTQRRSAALVARICLASRLSPDSVAFALSSPLISRRAKRGPLRGRKRARGYLLRDKVKVI